MAELAVETRGLSKYFGARIAVSDLSLAIPRGEIFGFLGPNGAGKTTSVKLLLSLVKPSAGSGTVLGEPIGDRPTRGRIGFLPEHFRFHDCLTGREFLRFHGRLYGLGGRALETRVDSLLERVDLADAADVQLRQYSKGMTQRAGIAQALLNDPDLVFLDEPTSGLDPLGRLLVRDLLRELRARGTTVFLNSHLLGEVEATCDRVVFVKHGRTVRELALAEAAGPIDVELRLGTVAQDGLAGIAGLGRVIERTNSRVVLRLEDDRRVPAVVRWLVERGIDVYQVRQRQPSLEQVFLQVMGDDQRPG